MNKQKLLKFRKDPSLGLSELQKLLKHCEAIPVLAKWVEENLTLTLNSDLRSKMIFALLSSDIDATG